MARHKNSYTPEEQLEKITIEIDNMENTLKQLKITKKELTDKVRQNQLSELDQLISEKGLSFEDVRKLLEDNMKNNKE